jgi:hypothetical protein
MGIELGCKPVLSVAEIYLFREKPSSPQPCWCRGSSQTPVSATGANAVKRPKPDDNWFANNLHAWGLVESEVTHKRRVRLVKAHQSPAVLGI